MISVPSAVRSAQLAFPPPNLRRDRDRVLSRNPVVACVGAPHAALQIWHAFVPGVTNRPEAPEQDPEDSVTALDAGPWDAALEHRDLLPKGQVLQSKVRLRD